MTLNIEKIKEIEDLFGYKEYDKILKILKDELPHSSRDVIEHYSAIEAISLDLDLLLSREHDREEAVQSNDVFHQEMLLFKKDVFELIEPFNS